MELTLLHTALDIVELPNEDELNPEVASVEDPAIQDQIIEGGYSR
jgi:hypothetical protein